MVKDSEDKKLGISEALKIIDNYSRKTKYKAKTIMIPDYFMGYPIYKTISLMAASQNTTNKSFIESLIIQIVLLYIKREEEKNRENEQY